MMNMNKMNKNEQTWTKTHQKKILTEELQEIVKQLRPEEKSDFELQTKRKRKKRAKNKKRKKKEKKEKEKQQKCWTMAKQMAKQKRNKG